MAKQYGLGDFLKDINTGKQNLLRQDPEARKDFPPFLINRNLANFVDTILYVEELNMRPYMDKDLQYDYLIHSINKRKRFAKTPKPQKEEDIELLKRYFMVNNEKADQYYALISEDDMQEIRKQFVTGGKK